MLSTFPTLLPFLLFAFVASITPGPTNILVLSNSARYGFKAALPFIFGACISAAMIVWLVGSGFGKVLNTYPGTGTATQVIGNVWLTYLSWQIFRAPLDSMVPTKKPSVQPRQPGLVDAAALQLINPKTWMMALAVVSVFVPDDNEKSTALLQLSVIFFSGGASLPGCMGGSGRSGGQTATFPPRAEVFQPSDGNSPFWRSLVTAVNDMDDIAITALITPQYNLRRHFTLTDSASCKLSSMTVYKRLEARSYGTSRVRLSFPNFG